MEIVTGFFAYLVSYAHSLLVMPTYIYVAVIALFFGLIAKDFAGVIFGPVMAGFIFLAVVVLAPVLLNNASLKFPEMDLAFAKLALAVYIVFLVLDTVVFLIKKLILKITG
jgi:hypothetical protein